MGKKKKKKKRSKDFKCGTVVGGRQIGESISATAKLTHSFLRGVTENRLKKRKYRVSVLWTKIPC